MSTLEKRKNIRVRFAPAPTGKLHIGGLRTALFNVLFARHQYGTFLIRIEDTDLERSRPEHTQELLAALAWAGITSDEPVLIQSEREPEHRALIDQLLHNGHAYRCYCSAQALIDRLQQESATDEEAFKRYDRLCYKKQQAGERFPENIPYAVRFKIPDLCTEVVFHDLVRGLIRFERDQLDDFIIARSDGRPIYNFVVVADDAFMRISHVIRGEDHISNTPKQILLYEALGFQVPQFAHLPMILGASGQRLSKREGATSTQEYRAQGYVAEALICYLARLGWSHGDQEIFSFDELVRHFSLDHVGKKGAVFDVKKLQWVNAVFIKQMAEDELIQRIISDVDAQFVIVLVPWSFEQQKAVIRLFKERVSTLVELVGQSSALLCDPKNYNDADMKKWITAQSREYLHLLHLAFENLAAWNTQELTTILERIVGDTKASFAAVAQPLRIALTGKSGGPSASEMSAIIGKEVVLRRLQALLAVSA